MGPEPWSDEPLCECRSVGMLCEARAVPDHEVEGSSGRDGVGGAVALTSVATNCWLRSSRLDESMRPSGYNSAHGGWKGRARAISGGGERSRAHLLKGEGTEQRVSREHQDAGRVLD
eukprot:scaffold98291_cov32-Tisochrysis_lutea.AAC.4